jgi:hypothetical protein
MLSIKTRPFPREQSAREHAEIVELVLKRDADAATALLALHITKGAALPLGDRDRPDCPLSDVLGSPPAQVCNDGEHPRQLGR